MKTSNPNQNPPRWLDKLANKICAPHLREELLGDLYERYALRIQKSGPQKAYFFFLREVFSLFRLSIMRRKPATYPTPSLFSIEMIRNYFKIGSRVLLKNKGYSFIHLIGLSIGLWACMMVATVVLDSLSYDRQWSRGKDIYRIVSVDEKAPGMQERMSSSHEGLAAEFQRLFPEVETWSSFSSWEGRFKLHEKDEEGMKAQILQMDTTAWQMLDVKVLTGNPKLYIPGTTNIIISRSYADQLYPGQDLTGRIIYDVPTYQEKGNPYMVTGIIEDLPYNSHLRADIIQIRHKKISAYAVNGFFAYSQNYLMLKPKTDIAAFSDKVNTWFKSLHKEQKTVHIELQPMEDIYLHSDFADRQNVKGDARTIYIFLGIAVLLLFIACVNFVNLSTARAFSRLKETGVRKFLSGSRAQLVLQFLTETLLIFGVSVVIATGLYYFSLDKLENFLGHKLVQTFFSNPEMTGFALLTIFLTGLLTGFYPAWLVSGFRPSNTLRGVIAGSLGQNTLRKSLVVIQFSISIVVLLSTVVVWKQLSFMKNKDLGYNKKNLISIESVSWDGKADAFKGELFAIPGVTHASITRWMPTQGGGYMTRYIPDPSNPGKRLALWYIAGDVDLPETIGWKLSKGRLFHEENSSDALNADSLQKVDFVKYEELSMQQASLLTESAARILGVAELNEKVKEANTVPVGVIRDFNNESLYEPIKPTIITAHRDLEYGGMLIRTQPGTGQQVMQAVHKLWKTFYPAKLLELNLVEDQLAAQYESENRLQQLFVFFSGLTIFLSALGIFGLVVQAAEQRAKEVGIRKVLGASVTGIVGLLSREFVLLVIVAIVVASPIGWFGLNRWLENYPYRTGIDWWIFVVTGGGTLLVTAATVSIQALRAARVDPVKTLRSE